DVYKRQEHALPKALPSPTSEDSTLLAHVTARTVKETNLRIVTNINLVYPDQPALESTNATFNFINIPIVVPTALTAEVSVSYFAGYIIPVMLSVNDRLVATNLCNLPSGWCAWRATNDLVGNIILTPGTNVVRLFRRGNMPNILEVFVRRAASLQTSETAPSSPLDVSSPPATSPN
ncbi:MAG: hypothetical protein N2595_07715, partial [bacterium]|nr:hypothetical protein [bacterium]